MRFEILPILRNVTEPIDRIINCFIQLVGSMFGLYSNGDISLTSWSYMVLQTIIRNPYLLITISLLLCGFVIGIIKRIISV